MANDKEWPAISAMVNEEWPAINIDKDYALENTQAPPELAFQWRRFLEHLMVFSYDDPGPWTRTTVKTRADDPLLLQDLAVYPQK